MDQETLRNFSSCVTSRMKNYLYDSHYVRYELYQSNGRTPYNWLFFPGGPGADSSYLRSLIDELELPGNVWLIDLPGSGSNVSESYSENFNEWVNLFPEIIKRFDNPVLVGHSFGGMFPLLFPELESYLKGFVILNSAPALWQEEAVAYSKQFDLPDLSKEMQDFTVNPNPETFKTALAACMPYYFPQSTLEQGRELLAQVDFQYQPAVWWQRKARESNFSAKWIPQKVPTLIIGSKYDCVCPFALFQKDQRFQRSNIELLFIEDAGHMIWLENPVKTKEAFEKMVHRIDRVAMEMHTEKPKSIVGVGVFVFKEDKVLLGKRKGAHGAGDWAPPGGHLEFGESVEDCAKRELREETGLKAFSVQTGSWSNHVIDERKHYITFFAVIDQFEGEPELLEPQKCEEWQWFSVDALPSPLFLPAKAFFSEYNSSRLKAFP